MQAMGIDIGTTTISIVMINGETGEVLGSKTAAHHAFMKGATSASRIQNPQKLLEITRTMMKEMIMQFGVPKSIGMTGQMHGILYVDEKGETVSPFYTWQDAGGNELMKDGRTYAEVLKEATGAAASGYGLTTHFYLQKKGMIPPSAVKMVTISDYIAMKLCGKKEPAIAKDMAAGFGCFDLEIGDFCREELEDLGIELSYLPEILPGHGVIGQTVGEYSGIPVAASLGDNQASILGSVRDLSNTVLINVGTGSQVSFGTARYVEAQGAIELRPCTDSLYLMTGSGLCGGRAYAMLEGFYREACGNQHGSLYEVMETQAREFMEVYGQEAAWKIRTAFSGTRSRPKERGSITGISVENFHPGAMTLGMLRGIIEELYEMYEKMCEMTDTKASQLVGSGNGLRKNVLMRELAMEIFRMPMEIPVCQEEAACGAAMQGAVSAGFAGSMMEMQQKIRYEE